ncbi:MAG: DUF1761 domain-containing protein [Flavisolibacter sp.]|jgi:hypothetical protein
MDTSSISNLPWLHVLVAAIAYFALGSIWYSALFGKKWVSYQQINMNDPKAKEGVAAIMIGSFVWMFITTVGLAIFAGRLNLVTAAAGVKLGLLTGICFSASAISISYLYVKKPLGLHLIDSFYHIIGQVIAAVILCAWR